MTDSSEIRNTLPSTLIPNKRSVEDPIEYDKEIKIQKVTESIEIKEVVENNGENNNGIQTVLLRDISEEVEEISVEEGLSIGNNYQQPVPGDDEQNDDDDDGDDGEDLENEEGISGEDSFGDSDDEDDSGLEEVEFANSNNDNEEEEEDDDDVEIVGETENGYE
ncbi:unnamed protein product [[Candida] boidinii]|nr:unnamed protein product [[Candida] boidinii]